MNDVKNNKRFSILEISSLIIMSVIIAFYVIVSCFVAGTSSKVDGSVSGWYVIIGIPIGLVICEIFPIISIIISAVNNKKRIKVLSILEIGFSLLTIYALNFFHSTFLTGTMDKNIFFYINVFVVIISSAFIITNMIMNRKS